MGEFREFISDRTKNARGPKLEVSGNSISKFYSKKHFGPEAREVLLKKFERFGRKETGELKNFGLGTEDHPHPLGATKRAMHSDLIWCAYHKTGLGMDLGTSMIRASGMYDEPRKVEVRRGADWILYDQIEVPTLDRMICVTPKLGFKDHVRVVNNIPRGVEHIQPYTNRNRCDCVTGLSAGCVNCNQIPDFTVATDSAYYPGVINKIVENIVKADYLGKGYVILNDFHKAYTKTGQLKGETCDKESKYEIYKGKQGETRVRMWVRGNDSPYDHQILNTGGHDSWNTIMTIKIAGVEQNVIVTFHRIDETMDKDLPYATFTLYVRPIPKNENGVDMAEEIEDIHIPHMSGLWATVPFEKDVPAYSYEDNKYKKILDGIIDKNPIEKQLRISESHNLSIQSKQLVIDYCKQSEEFVSSLRLWDSIMFEWNNFVSAYETNERIATVVREDGKLDIICEIYSTKVLGLTTKFKSHKLVASLDSVLKAYIHLGNKKTLDSLTNACSLYQKEIGEIFGMEGVTGAHDAYLIARVIRAQQERRGQAVFEASSSIAGVKRK